MNVSNINKKFSGSFFILTWAIIGISSTCWSGTPLIVSGHPDYPPYMWNQDGKLLGIGAEISKTVCRELKLDCQMQPIDSWKRVQELARTGKVDIIVGAYSNTERRSYMDYSIAYMQDPTNIFVDKKRPFTFSKKEDLIGKRGIAMFGESYGQDLDTFIVDKLDLSRTYTTSAAFKNLTEGKVDYMFWGYYPWMINARRLGMLGRCEVLPPTIVKEGMHLTVSKKSSAGKLLPKINKIIRRLQQNGTIKNWSEQFLQAYQPPSP